MGPGIIQWSIWGVFFSPLQICSFLVYRKYLIKGQEWWYMPIIPAVCQVKMEEPWFEAHPIKVSKTLLQRRGSVGLCTPVTPAIQEME
jgi:hypothetical protein